MTDSEKKRKLLARIESQIEMKTVCKYKKEIIKSKRNTIVTSNIKIKEKEKSPIRRIERLSTIRKNSHLDDKSNHKLSVKYFICVGYYPDMVEAFVKRGWIELKDRESMKFDYKWTLKLKDLPKNLNPNQMVNHFWNNTEITKKSGLSKNLRNMILKGIDTDNFYPRCYDFTNKLDFEDFIEDFKFTKAISILKDFYSKSNTAHSEKCLISCLIILERKISLIEMSEDENFNLSKNANFLIGENEWVEISGEDSLSYQKELEKLERMKKIGVINTRTKLQVQNKHAKEEFDHFQDSEQIVGNLNEKIENILRKIKSYFPQYEINGVNNIWILKPSGLSRGRGIICKNNLIDILKYLKANSNNYISQKYIENPLLIKGRKFDIRQWVLVTSIDPLVVWIYETPYLRFGAEDYKLEEFSNLFSHLTNNSVVKYSKNFHNEKFEGNMWEIGDFSEYLRGLYGRDVWKDELQEKVKKIIVTSLYSATNFIRQRKNSHELFGYDLMIDDHLNVWLIEVNSSPAMDYSTSITEKLVKQMSDDLVKVVVDYASANDADKTSISTGAFTKIIIHHAIDNNYLPNRELIIN